MRVANRFVDPTTGAYWDWPLNHYEESPVTKSRQMADGASTSNMSLIPQEGAPSPLIFQWKGNILDPDQLDQMLVWWQMCDLHSIHVIDFAGDEYEILITDFQPARKAVARNQRQPDKPWTWEYTLIFRVLTVISGPWLGVTP